MIIRDFQEQDIPQVIHMGGRMHEESQYSVLEYNPESALGVCRQVLNSDDYFGTVVLKDGVLIGMLAGYVCEYLYGDDKIAEDMLVYVAPEHRGSHAFLKMVREYVKWAGGKGAKLVFLTQTSGVEIDKVTDLYNRLGLIHVGGIFTKVM